MGRPFVSHDGPDPQGVRAEVVVESHTGTVKEISELDKVAKVSFLGDGLNKPVHGYIQIDDPVLDIIKEAKKAKETVNYRIEIIRKKGVDRSTSMSELRKDMDTARDNVTKIIAGINGHFTTEAVTNPEEDMASDGVYNARNMKPTAPSEGSTVLNPDQAMSVLSRAVHAGVPHEVISSLLASALQAGVAPAEAMDVAYPKDTVPDQVQQFRSREEPVFRKYNTDGTLNLGSSQIIAGVSSENFVRRMLSTVAENTEEFNALVEHFAAVVLAIADTIQVAAYKNGNADRMAGSHTRIRGVVYDVIENTFPLPALTKGYTPEDEFKWVANVGALAKQRFFAAIRISESSFDFYSLVPKKAEPVAPQTEATAPQAEAVAPQAETPVEATVAAKKAAPAKTKKAEAVAPPVEAPVEVPGDEDTDMDFELFEPTYVEEPNPQVPSDAVVDKLKAMLAKYEVPKEALNMVGSLLEYSFGHRAAKDIPEDTLKEFIVFYDEKGKENLHAALKNVNDLL